MMLEAGTKILMQFHTVSVRPSKDQLLRRQLWEPGQVHVPLLINEGKFFNLPQPRYLHLKIKQGMAPELSGRAWVSVSEVQCSVPSNKHRKLKMRWSTAKDLPVPSTQCRFTRCVPTLGMRLKYATQLEGSGQKLSKGDKIRVWSWQFFCTLVGYGMKSRALAGYTLILAVHGSASISEALSPKKLHLYTHVHRSSIHNGQDMEMSTDRQKNQVSYNYTIEHQLTCKRAGIF